MANLRAVIFSTDGQRDYAVTPDGQKHILGAVSVLKVISELVPGAIARKALDEFNKNGSTMVPVDLDAMFKMLAPKRARFADRLVSILRENPYGQVPGDCNIQDQATATERTIMSDDKALKDAIENQISTIKRQIDVLNQKAKDSTGQSAADMKAEAEKLGDLIKWLKKPSPYGDQGKNDTFYGLPGGTPGGAKMASYDTLAANSNIAETVIQQVAETTETIDRLVAAGRKFNASKALEDLHTITARTTEILANVDLAQPWVENDLNALAKQAAHIHGLFHGVK